MTTTVVSVVIAAYNSMPHLDETLRSLIGQSYRPLQIVVADDGSTDGTGDWGAPKIPDRGSNMIFVWNGDVHGTAETG